MILSFRQQEIMDAARESGRVLVDDLASRFQVTPQTIRRDLNELCERGMLARVHGGAVLASGIENVGYETRRVIAADEKNEIGRLCASEIPHNASLFMNIGTTTEAVARALLGHRNLLVITNNLNVANTLTQNPSCEIIVAGGLLRRSDGGLVGEATAEFVKKFKVDYAVIGASAMDEDGALLDYDYREVRVAQAIIENARQVFLVADRTKLSRSAPVRIAHISQVSALFTDEVTSPRLSQVCTQGGVKVFCTANAITRISVLQD
ncbi:DeoR/GlpR transcriptional regulator [Haematospirillum jordaniae]|uniref:DeoR family transcriptional regulator n=1 Tax=Haematospirillum jordaniae TaxID=1549855 RepID=A0A143DE58_9PROT|nr:DeoR/GlpR family DNA-binding transcription regulator [Haematospirillum jordaniae]AMW35007.1 DeoR family transcriptional regulator [Haematospirillum jordaniae]NKD44260.1 DeoR/GlpR transcriptional regulator [Haematospirillum jordaniae]NKD56639.1 DeoR/GlpR transcriptional regulator [Haematospirillum jordaniae]NKD58697.1 DeoR/GlpR transcriptional regulator [Haematospirillum jordaniae]NKD66134.1 DeoR/GlpR transcriptional regulator [Haematospirillum jordaniae]